MVSITTRTRPKINLQPGKYWACKNRQFLRFHRYAWEASQYETQNGKCRYKAELMFYSAYESDSVPIPRRLSGGKDKTQGDNCTVSSSDPGLGHFVSITVLLVLCFANVSCWCLWLQFALLISSSMEGFAVCYFRVFVCIVDFMEH